MKCMKSIAGKRGHRTSLTQGLVNKGDASQGLVRKCQLLKTGRIILGEYIGEFSSYFSVQLSSEYNLLGSISNDYEII